MTPETQLKRARKFILSTVLRGKISYATMAELVRWLRRLECQTQAKK